MSAKYVIECRDAEVLVRIAVGNFACVELKSAVNGSPKVAAAVSTGGYVGLRLYKVVLVEYRCCFILFNLVLYSAYYEIAEGDLCTLVLTCAVIEACKVNAECKSGRLNAVCITATGDNVIHFLSCYELVGEGLPFGSNIGCCGESGEIVKRVLLALIES